MAPGVKVNRRVRVDIQGKPKSGRVWKNEKKRYSSINDVKPLKSTWSEKMKKRIELQATKDQEKLMRLARQKEIQEKRERREENERRRKENEKKAEVVQKIKNTKKLKRMTKKQWKAVEKR